MTRPWLSVLVPTLNGARFVSDALSSIERERDSGIQCVVVDGGSRDETVAIVKSFASRLDLVILERPESPSWVWSTNLALAHALAPHSSLLHQDDRWLPGRAAGLRRLITQMPEANLIVHAAMYIDSLGRKVGRLSCPWPPAPPSVSPREALPALLVQNFIAAPAAAFRTETAVAVGGLDEALWYTADWDLWLKLASRGQVAYCPDELAAFRVHGGSQTARRSIDHTDFLRQMDVVVDRYLGRIDPPDLRESVGRAARFSNQVNAALAAKSHGASPDWGRLAGQGIRMGPGGWLRYWRDSRISARVFSRLRAGQWATDAQVPAMTASPVKALRAALDRHRPIRFVVVGALNTAFSYGLYAALIFLGTGLAIASLVSLVLGVLFGFVTHGTIVFRSRLGGALWRFIAVWAVIYVVFIGVVLLAERVGINHYAGGAIAVPIVAMLSYVLQRRFVFPAAQGR